MASGSIGTWSRLGRSVEAGELYLEPGTARACAERCSALIAELRSLRDRAAELGVVDGFGILQSGQALAEKFGKKAVGGEYSLVQALSDHIDEVEGMQALFEKIEARYSATDDDTASKFGVIEHG
ncbi:hypothetical protein [Rhodococcus spongiicola]|uniref:Uncharacterized protein n=1 Tax=Rhodococcus spongiicola TaxID=2487352 RepID=A0A438B4R2_9NOCA|nr:hypothetical protein [Rhodococcus spongiicola]RVW05994.1 hypothetical protein EF834_00500 [Rhodococcus spongiicola]